MCPARPAFMLPVGRNPVGTMVTVAVALLVESCLWQLRGMTRYCSERCTRPLAVMEPPAAPSCTLQVTFEFEELFAAVEDAHPCGPNSVACWIDRITNGWRRAHRSRAASPCAARRPAPPPPSREGNDKPSRISAAILAFKSASLALRGKSPLDDSASAGRRGLLPLMPPIGPSDGHAWTMRTPKAGTVKRQGAAPSNAVFCSVFCSPASYNSGSPGPR